MADPWEGRAELSFAGTSTLHDWAGVVVAQPFTAEVAVGADGRVTRVEARAEARVAEMNTDNEGRDENLRKAMQATVHPLVAAKAAIEALPATSDPATSWGVPVTLELMGRQQVVQAVASHWMAEGDRVTFDLAFTVSLEASGIRIPAVLFFIRVGDEIHVTARVTLHRR